MKSYIHMIQPYYFRFGQFIKTTLLLYVGLIAEPLYADSISSEVIPDNKRHEVLVLGRVSAGPKRHYKAFDSLGKYLVKRLSDYGIKRHSVLLPHDNEEMIMYLREGKIDLLSETPFSALLYEESADAQILLRQWKGGVPSYRTLFVARKDSPLNNLSDLGGGIIAFEDPGSTSAYFVPMLTLKKEGMNVIPQEGSNRNTDEHTVRYIFARSEENILYSVIRGTTDAGVISNLDWNNTKQAPAGLKRDLKIFYETPDILRSLLLAQSDLPSNLKIAIIDVLTKMHEDKKGQKILNKYFKVSRFDQLNGKAADELNYARKLFAEFSKYEN